MRFNFLEQFYTLALGAWDHKNLKSLIVPYREVCEVWVFTMLIWDLHPNEWLSILKTCWNFTWTIVNNVACTLGVLLRPP